MKIEWTNTFTYYFDLDQAQEDFNAIMEWNPDKDPEQAIFDAVYENFNMDGEEYINTEEAISIAAKALRERIGGVQMEMEDI